jgi:hypothetical protein
VPGFMVWDPNFTAIPPGTNELSVMRGGPGFTEMLHDPSAFVAYGMSRANLTFPGRPCDFDRSMGLPIAQSEGGSGAAA